MAFKTPVLALTTTALFIVAPAYAQNATTKAEVARPADTGAGEIIVTAQRRRESLQRVNIAATALSGDSLGDKAVVRQLDLQNAAPGLSIVKAGLTESVNIRGIGLASGSPQVANGVASYVDGLFQPPIVSTGVFYDIDNIEVLRGPQGTLVGSNSTGGAIFINTKKPELNKLGATINLEGGSFGHVQADAAVNLPIGNTLAVRVAGLDSHRDSYYTDIGPSGNQPDRLNEQDTRAMILWKPGNFSAMLKSETIERQTGGYAYQPISGVNAALTAGRTNIPYTLNYNTTTSNFERAFINSLELKYVTDGGLTLRSLTGYQNKRINNLYDNDATAVANSGQNQFVREKQYSQEINIISPTKGVFNYIVGGYFQRNVINVRIFNFNTATNAPSLWIEPDTNKLVLGVFAQANYKFNSQFELQAGARYSHFDVTGAGGVYVGRGTFGGPTGINVSPQTGTESDGRVSGKVALNWTPDNTNLFYVFAARGYKPGGINPPGGKFAPETVWDYEAGWKGSFMDRHIKTQIGAFYNDYQNFQDGVQDPASGQTGVQNISSATIKGFEAQVQAKFGGFSLDGGIAYTDSKLSPVTIINTRLEPPNTSLPQCATGVANGATCYNYTYQTAGGGTALYAPKWTWNAGIQYDVLIGDGSKITPRLNYSYVGSEFVNLLYNPAYDLIASHALLSAEITYTHKNLSLKAYGTNLTKEYYISGQSGNNEFYGAPREFGVRLSGKF